MWSVQGAIDWHHRHSTTRHQLAPREGYHSAQLSCLKYHCVCGSRADNIAHIPLQRCLWFQQPRPLVPYILPRSEIPSTIDSKRYRSLLSDREQTLPGSPKPQREGGFWCNFSRQNAGGRGKELDVDHCEEMANPLSLIYLLFSIISRNPISHFLPDRSRAVSFVLRHSDFHLLPRQKFGAQEIK